MSQNTLHTTIAAGDAKNRFGEVLDTAQREPVVIQKHGRAVAVILSADEYARFEELEDAAWGKRAVNALKKPAFIGTKRSAAYISRVMHAQNRPRR